METINLKQAVDIFEENRADIRQACVKNMEFSLKKLEKPNPAKAKSYNHFWVQANVYQLKRESIIDQYKPTIRAIDVWLQPKQAGAIQELDVEQAKAHPIAELLNTQGKKGNVSCPFHQDRKPSLQIKKNNTFTCYSCGEYGDSIDLYQKLHNVDFITAVKALQ